MPKTMRADNGLHPLKFRVMAIEGDTPRAIPKTARERALQNFNDPQIQYGCEVSSGGQVREFYMYSLGVHGGYSQLEKADFARLNSLLAHLPADGGRIPPPERRLVFQVRATEQAKVQVRIYDRANIPEIALEIMRLANARIRPYVSTLAPSSHWSLNQKSSKGFFGLTPKGDQFLSTTWDDPLRFWDLTTHQLQKKVTLQPGISAENIEFSPDGSLAALEGWGQVNLYDTKTWKMLHTFDGLQQPINSYLCEPHFTPDGRFLLLQQGRFQAQKQQLIVDTQTGKWQSTLPDIPKGALTFTYQPGQARALYLSESGALLLWDTQKKQAIATLDKNTRIYKFAFSPDGLMVAITTINPAGSRYRQQYQIRVWRTDTGRLVHELRAFGQATCAQVDSLTWTTDSRYILAAVKNEAPLYVYGIAMWDVQSGRHQAELEGCSDPVAGIVALPSQQIVAGSEDGIARTWDLPKAIDKINALRATMIQ